MSSQTSERAYVLSYEVTVEMEGIVYATSAAEVRRRYLSGEDLAEATGRTAARRRVKIRRLKDEDR